MKCIPEEEEEEEVPHIVLPLHHNYLCDVSVE